MKTYYEKQIETLNKINDLESKKTFVKGIDYSIPIEKDSDAQLVKELRMFEEIPMKERGIENKKIEVSEKQILRQEVIELISGKDKQWGKATEILSNYITNEYYIYTTKDDKQSEVWVYKEGIYISQGRSEIKEILRDIMKDFYSIYIFNRVMEKVEVDTFIDSDKFFNTNYVNEIPVKNGILNILTGELNPFNPKKVFFNKINAKYNPDATCQKIDQFLSDVLSNKEDKKVFYELGGFTLLKEYKFEKAFMFVGNGRNGKDKSLELIKRLLGVDNCCSVPLASIVPDSFIISKFHNKMANLAGEINNQDLKDTSMFKALTGRSLISAQRKYLNTIDFVNYAKFIFACNDLPMVYDNSKGFWDRWVLLEFPYTFVTEREYNESKDKTNLKIRDESIIEKIISPEEMSGLLNEFLKGLKRILENREFSKTDGSDQVKQIWIRKSNSVMAFVMSRIKEEYNRFISKKDFRKEYSKFCKEHKISNRSDIVIKRTLEEIYGVTEERKELFPGNWERVWEGITWK
jgi:putative DNA primase/helicase